MLGRAVTPPPESKGHAPERPVPPSTGRLRVALLSFEFGESVAPLANALSRRASVCLLLPEEERALYGGPLDPSVEYVPFTRPRLRHPLRQLRLMAGLIRAIRRFEPDVVHLQQGHLWLNPLLGFLRRYPLVITVHDPAIHPGDLDSKKTPQSVNNLGFRAADRLITHAQTLADELVRISGVRRETIDVIPLGVDPFVGAEAGRIAEEPATILFFGRIWPYKGLEYLIRAEPRIAAEVPSLRIVIAGEGEPFDRYRALMANPERFETHNAFLSHDLRERLFSRASVVVLPYVEASQSGVVPVAYAYGKPVVATTVGGLPEAVEDSVTGILVPPRSVEALADAVIRLLRDGSLRRRLGEAAGKRYESTLSLEAIAEQTLEVYALAVERARSA